jgi:integrase
MSVAHLPRTTAAPTLTEATRRFLRRDAFEPSTRSTYSATLDLLADRVGKQTPVDAITNRQVEDLLDRWQEKAATTYNRHRAAMLSFFGWCAERQWVVTNPVMLTEPRKIRRRTEDARRERPISRDLLPDLWALQGVGGRDRLLWRMAYETWARADELLGIDIEALDLGRREGTVHAKGGNVETIWWSTGSARLLPRLISGRTRGPLFLAARRPTRPMPVADVDPATGRARLGYRQAERLFTAVGSRLDPTGAPWTLHRLRHSGIAHAVEDGWSTPAVRAKSRHASIRSLEVYANPSAEAVRAMTDALDSEARRFRGSRVP